MDLPSFQSASFDPSRSRSDSIFASSPQSSTVDHRGAVHKRSSNDRSRSISTLQPERLYQLAVDQAKNLVNDLSDSSLSGSDADVRWITPQHSPSLTGYTSAPAIDSYPQWTAPTPPHSDSGGLAAVSIDANDDPAACASQDFSHFEQPPVSAEMSSLGYLLPSQYGGTSSFDSDASHYAMDQNYIPPMRAAQAPTSDSPSAYAPQTTSSNPSLYQSRGPEPLSSSRRSSDMAGPNNVSSFDQTYRRISSPYEISVGSNYSMPPTQTIPSISGLTHSPLPSPHLGSNAGPHMSTQYTTSNISRSPSLYDTYNQQSSYTTTAPSATQLYPTSQRYPPPPFIGSNANDTPSNLPIPSSKPGSSSSNASPADPSVRVLNARPKPQCWDHGCNGRQFSTFSNLLRHQREKSGTANKSYCPKCGAEFTRTTARNGHLAHDKCTKQRRESDAK